MTRPIDKDFSFGFGYGKEYPPDLAHLTIDGLHHGQDILTPVGSVLYAPCDFILNAYGISSVPPISYYGKYIIGKFRRLEGLAYTQYRFITMHLDRIFLRRVNIGDHIKENTVIGLTGDSGSAIGHPHLHFEVQKYSKGKWAHVDPSFLIGST